jgi:uracil phosphoribosyltransferase
MFVLTKHSSIANKFLSELRDISVQKDSMRFRLNLERLGEIMAYEISKTFHYSEREIITPLASTLVKLPEEKPVVFAVLRASLPFYQGFINFFDDAESGFIGAFREEGETITINLGYHASPSLEGKTVILADPMLATGKSFLKSISTLLKHGTPKEIHIAAVIAAPEGIKFLEENLEIPFHLWVGAIDEKLNSKSYIVPGLGDAGDLAFGQKL